MRDKFNIEGNGEKRRGGNEKILQPQSGRRPYKNHKECSGFCSKEIHGSTRSVINGHVYQRA
jgi:hypothetical protein